MSKQRPAPRQFHAELVARGPKGAWTHMYIPFDVHEVFGSKARVPVSGTINGFPFRTSIMPVGDGAHYMAITREMQKGANVVAGDTVSVVMQVDTQERSVEVPEDFKAALTRAKAAESHFATLAYSRRKEFVVWLTEAKKPETRAQRIEKSIAILSAGKHLDR